MKKPDDIGRLQDIFEAIERIELYIRETTEKTFIQDLMRQDAIMHQMEIIGEAGRNVSAEFQGRHQEIPWSHMIGLRNKITHDYSGIDIQAIWKTAVEDLPRLKQALTKLVEEAKG